MPNAGGQPLVALNLPATQPVDLYSTFVRTQSSDQWVRGTFHVQQRYARALVVSADGKGPQTIRAAAPDLNSRPGGNSNPEIEYPVAQVFTTLQAAYNTARGGDLIAVMPGRYESWETTFLKDRPDTGDRRYIHIKALGPPGAVVMERLEDEESLRAYTFLVSGSYLIIEGFVLQGCATPEAYIGSSAGILINGDFGTTGQLSHHIAVVNCLSRSHWKWGMHAVFCHSVLVQDNVFADARLEHGLYMSNGSDNVVIRRNVFQGNASCGLQCNMDLNSCITYLVRHPDMVAFRGPDRGGRGRGAGTRPATRPATRPTTRPERRGGGGDYVPPGDGGRGRLLQILAAADRRFGHGAYPDGLGINYIIENNVACGNGAKGGGAFNLAGLRDSLIQNNLIYHNSNHGLTLYDDSDSGYDRALVRNPTSRAAFTGPDMLPSYGSTYNLIRNNTVLLDNHERFALPMINGCFANKIRNNILINEHGDSVHVTSASIWHHDSGYNIVNTNRYVTYNPSGYGRPYDLPLMPADVLLLATATDEDNNSPLGVTLEEIAPQFVRYGLESWVVMKDGWWALNPHRPDFRPRAAGGPLIVANGDPSEMPAVDLLNHKRVTADIGAFAAAE